MLKSSQMKRCQDFAVKYSSKTTAAGVQGARQIYSETGGCRLLLNPGNGEFIAHFCV